MLIVVLLIVGFILLLMGASLLIEGSVSLARLFRIPELVIATTIIAIGTSMPEAFISISASLQGESNITISDIIGSNYFNLLVVCGVCSIFYPLQMDEDTIKKKFPFLIFSGVLLLFLAADYLLHGKNVINYLSKTDGIILLCIFFGLYGNIIWKNRNKETNNNITDFIEEYKNYPKWKTALFIVIGFIILKIGGDIVLNCAIGITTKIKLNQDLIGFTIISIGAGLPELVTSILSIKKGKAEFAIGNIIGSTIINILLILGISIIIRPIPIEINHVYDCIFLSLVNIITWLFVVKTQQLKRTQGCIMISLYIVYVIFVCMR